MLLDHKKTQEIFKDGFCPVIAFKTEALKDGDEMSIRLSIGLIGIIKTCQKLNLFLETVGSLNKIDINPLKAILPFLLEGTKLSGEEERAFFEVQKQINFHERSLNELTECLFWDYKVSEKISAAVLGMPLESLIDLEYSDTVNCKMMLDFEKATEAYQSYVFSDTPYEEFVPKAKQDLSNLVRKYSGENDN